MVPDDAGAKEQPCGSLKHLAVNANNKVTHAALGGIAAILKAMGTHRDTAAVQEWAERHVSPRVRPLLPGVASFQHVRCAGGGTDAPEPRWAAILSVASAAEKQHHWSHDALEFGAGCVGGAVGIGVGHPFDTIKVRLQNDTAGHFKGANDVLKQTVRQEGASGLFKGIETPLISSLPIQAIIFGIYGVCLRRIGQYTREGIDPADGLPSADLQPIWHHFAAGTVTGAIQTPMLAASDYAKIQMQNQFEPAGQVKAQVRATKALKAMGSESVSGDKVLRRAAHEQPVLYRNSVHVMRSVYHKHGLSTTFRGTSATLLRDITYGQYFGQYGIKFTFAHIRVHTHTHTHTRTCTHAPLCICVCPHMYIYVSSYVSSHMCILTCAFLCVCPYRSVLTCVSLHTFAEWMKRKMIGDSQATSTKALACALAVEQN